MQLRRYRNTIETVIFFVDFARSSQWWTPPRVQGNVLREIFHVKKCSTPKKKKQIAPTTLMAPHQVSAFIFGGQKKPVFFRWQIPGPSINHQWRLWESSSWLSGSVIFFQQTWFRSKPKVCKKKSHCSDKMLGGGFAPTHLRNISQIGSSTQVEVNKKYLKKYLNPSSPLLAFFTRSGRGGMPRAAIIPKAVLADKFRTRS